MKEVILNLTKDQEALLFDMLPWKYQNMDNPGYTLLGQAFWEGYSPQHDQNFTVKFRRFDGASAVILWLAFKAVKLLRRLQGNKHAQNWCKLHRNWGDIGGRKYEIAKKVLEEFARDQYLAGAQAWSDIDGLTLSRKITSWLNEKLGGVDE